MRGVALPVPLQPVEPNGVQYARKKILSWPHVSPRRCDEPGTCGRGAYSAHYS